ELVGRCTDKPVQLDFTNARAEHHVNRGREGVSTSELALDVASCSRLVFVRRAPGPARNAVDSVSDGDGQAAGASLVGADGVLMGPHHVVYPHGEVALVAVACEAHAYGRRIGGSTTLRGDIHELLGRAAV